MLNLDRLRALHAVSAQGSIIAAAETLNVTTSAVSQQLAKLDRFAARRRSLAAAYAEALAPLAPLIRQATRPAWSDPVLHLMCVLIDFEAAGTTRRAVMEALSARGIGSQVHYIPVHRQPYYRARYGDLELPGAEAWYARSLSLPLYPDMADGDVARVVDALSEVLGL